jgi:hypothetical protein
LVKAIRQQNAPRRERLEVFKQLYADEPIGNDVPGVFRPSMMTRYNLVRSAVDTIHSKIASSWPRAMVITVDGDYSLSTRAEQQSKWLDGDDERLNMSELGPRVYQDVLTYGTGVIYNTDFHGRTLSERAFVGDLEVDPREEQHDCVRSMYRVRVMDRGILLEMYPDSEDAIRDAQPVTDPITTKLSDASDMVLVFEGWRLPDSPEAAGRHIVALDVSEHALSGDALEDEEWTRDHFPFSFCRWARVPGRFWGVGIPEQGMGPQAELNEISETLSESYHLFVPSVWAPKGSINVHKLTNEVGRVYEYEGTSAPPMVQAGGGGLADFAMREEALIQRFFQLIGVSQLSASSMKPAGLNSGKALVVHQDIESERFAIASRDYERFAVDTAKQRLSVATMLANRDDFQKEKLRVFGGSEGLEVVYFEAAKENDPYVIRCFPVSALSKSAAARIEEVESMVKAGFITDMHVAKELLRFPDLDRHMSIELAGMKVVRKSVEECLKGKSVPANPYAPKQYAVRYGALMHNLATLRGAPESGLACLRDYIQMTIELPDPMAAAAPSGAPAMPPGGPMPPPMGPPLSVVPPGA